MTLPCLVLYVYPSLLLFVESLPLILFPRSTQNDALGYGAIIDSFDPGALTIENSCFTNNKAYGNALVVSYGLNIGNLTNNYGLGNTVEWSDPLECTFAALANPNSFANIECVEFDATTCQRDAAPSSATSAPGPTVVPAPVETGMPSAPGDTAETAMPSISMVPTPTSAVTPAPSSQNTAPVPLATSPSASGASRSTQVAPLLAAMAIVAFVA
jgi:hypothetical protein